MSRGPHRFKQSDVTRAARAVAAAPRVGELITRRLIRVIPSGHHRGEHQPYRFSLGGGSAAFAGGVKTQGGGTSTSTSGKACKQEDQSCRYLEIALWLRVVAG
jgi:hypothetical protein